MSHVATLSRNCDSGVKFEVVTWSVARCGRGVLLSCATRFPNRALLFSVQQSPWQRGKQRMLTNKLSKTVVMNDDHRSYSMLAL